MHVDYTSAQTAERRRQKVEDVRKRSEFRKAHGLEDEGQGIFGGWTAKSDVEVLGPGMREGGDMGRLVVADASPVAATEQAREDGTYVDFEGNRQSTRKKWLGIW